MAVSARKKTLLGNASPDATPSNGQEWPKSETRGVYFRPDGNPRWIAKIRWELAGQKHQLEQRSWPVDLTAPKKSHKHIDVVQLVAESWAANEWKHLALTKTPYSLTATAQTLGGLLKRYLDEIDNGTIQYRSVRTDRSNIRTLLGLSTSGPNQGNGPALTTVMSKTLDTLTYNDFHSDSKQHHPHAINHILVGQDGKPMRDGPLKRVLVTIKIVYEHAKREWSINCVNPIKHLQGLTPNDEREVILSDEEWNLFKAELKNCEQATQDVIAVERSTAARRSEIIKLDWGDINFELSTAHLRKTKSRRQKGKTVDNSRTIPLDSDILAMLRRRLPDTYLVAKGPLKGQVNTDLVTSTIANEPIFINSEGKRLGADAITVAWSRARERIYKKTKNPKILNIRAHDLRHTAITEFGSSLTQVEAARVSGHKDLRTFFRYFNPRPEEIGKKIEAMRHGKTQSSKYMAAAVEALTKLTITEMTAALGVAITQVSARGK